MLFGARHLALAALASTMASALPLDAVPRAKSYAVVNVDGGSPTKAPAKPTTAPEEKTTTVEVANPGPTVTTTVVKPAPTRTVTSSSTSTSTKSEKPKTSVVTVTVTPSPTPIEYYDDGMWHTRYPIKSDAAPAVTRAPSGSTGA
jgi:Ulp1 family protease